MKTAKVTPLAAGGAALAAAIADGDEAAAGSQTLRAQLLLREAVVGGQLKAGERVTELALVERLGMSRTPIRAALTRLLDEGLLEALPGGGYVVRDFSEADIRDAIELRGTLEGLAARLAAERGCGTATLAGLREAVARIDELLAAPGLSEAAFAAYGEHNARFHALLSEACGSALVQRQLQRACTLPFASPNAFVMLRTTGTAARDRLLVAHEQHRAVVEAIARGEGARAEALMREHARNAHANLGEALASQQALQRLPGASLIRRGAR